MRTMLSRRVWLVALALGLAAGCGGGVRPEVVQGWVGRPVTALRQDWGPPTREVEDGANRILIYEEIERRSTGASFQAPRQTSRNDPPESVSQDSYRGPRVYARSYLFWVNREGAIVHVDVRQP